MSARSYFYRLGQRAASLGLPVRIGLHWLKGCDELWAHQAFIRGHFDQRH